MLSTIVTNNTLTVVELNNNEKLVEMHFQFPISENEWENLISDSKWVAKHWDINLAKLVLIKLRSLKEAFVNEENNDDKWKELIKANSHKAN